MPIVLPDTPTDRYEVALWRVYNDNLKGVGPLRYVYYTNCQWKEFVSASGQQFGGDRDGAPLIDCWMSYEFGNCTGRLSGWCGIKQAVEQSTMTFATRNEAVERFYSLAIARCDALSREIKNYERAILAVGNGGDFVREQSF
jgi:hypothetical protein